MFKFVFLLLCSVMMFASNGTSHNCNSGDYETWVALAFNQMDAVKVGMTREDVLKVFKYEGGVSAISRTRRTYVYKGSPYIHVDVEFTPVDGQENGPENPNDVISSISRPYLAQTAFD